MLWSTSIVRILLLFALVVLRAPKCPNWHLILVPVKSLRVKTKQHPEHMNKKFSRILLVLFVLSIITAITGIVLMQIEERVVSKVGMYISILGGTGLTAVVAAQLYLYFFGF